MRVSRLYGGLCTSIGGKHDVIAVVAIVDTRIVTQIGASRARWDQRLIGGIPVFLLHCGVMWLLRDLWEEREQNKGTERLTRRTSRRSENEGQGYGKVKDLEKLLSRTITDWSGISVVDKICIVIGHYKGMANTVDCLRGFIQDTYQSPGTENQPDLKPEHKVGLTGNSDHLWRLQLLPKRWERHHEPSS